MKTSSLTALVTIFAVYTYVQGQDKGLRRDKGLLPVGRRSADNVNSQSSSDGTGDDQKPDGLRTPDAINLIDSLVIDYHPNGIDMLRLAASDGELVPDYFLGFTSAADSWATPDQLCDRSSGEVTVMRDQQGDQDVPSTSNGVRHCPDCSQRHADKCRSVTRSKPNMQTRQSGSKPKQGAATDGELVGNNFSWLSPLYGSWTAPDGVGEGSWSEVTVYVDNGLSTSGGTGHYSDCSQRHIEECRPTNRNKTNKQRTQNGQKQEAVKRFRGKQWCEKRITEQKLDFYSEWLPKFIAELETCSNPNHAAFMSEYLREHRRLMVQLEEQLRRDIIERTAEIVTEAANLRTQGVEVDPHDPLLTLHLRRWCPTEDPTAQGQTGWVTLEMHNAWVTRAQQRIDELTAIYANLNTVTAENFNTQSTARQPVEKRQLIQQSIQELVTGIMCLRLINAVLHRQIRKERKELEALEKKMKGPFDDEDDGAPDHKKKKQC